VGGKADFPLRCQLIKFAVGASAEAPEFEVTEEANARFKDRMTKLVEKSLFSLGDCATSRSYYFNPDGEATLLRPTSTRNAIREGSRFPLSDYQFH
jgi:hypothetical protein